MVMNTSQSLTMQATHLHRYADTDTSSISTKMKATTMAAATDHDVASFRSPSPSNSSCSRPATTVSALNRKRQSIDNSMIRFPKLDECAHFHYEFSELTNFEVLLISNHGTSSAGVTASSSSPSSPSPQMINSANLNFFIHVHCGQRNWTVRRNLHDFRFLDFQLHKCTFDRQHSKLKPVHNLAIHSSDGDSTSINSIVAFIEEYLERLTQIVGPFLTCGPVLHWFEMDNKGNRLISELRDINTPAIGAAFVIKNHKKSDFETELSLEVGELVSVIEMPPISESFYWKGKKGFQVGFFPAECVQLIDDKISRNSNEYSLRPLNKCMSPTQLNSSMHQWNCHSPTENDSLAPRDFSSSPSTMAFSTYFNEGQNTSVAATTLHAARMRKQGLIASFLRSFVSSRSDMGKVRNRLKQSGILKERVFGCDLCEYLANSGKELPLVLVVCTEYIEKYGFNANGIYRLSGVASTIHKLRSIFDEDTVPVDLAAQRVQSDDDEVDSDSAPMDIHAVSSLLKLYFRELPNPLLTYSLYNSFIDTMRDQQMADDEKVHTIRSLIVSLPPPHWRTLRFLIRHLLFVSKFHESTGMTPKNLAIVWAPNLLRSRDLEQHVGFEALSLIGTQAVFTEFLILNCDKIFDREEHEIHPTKPLYSPFIAPQKCGEMSFSSKALKYIDVGPQITPGTYHTIITYRATGTPSGVVEKRSKFNLKRFHFFSARSPNVRVRPSLYNITNYQQRQQQEGDQKSYTSGLNKSVDNSLVAQRHGDDCEEENYHDALKKSVKRSQSFDSYLKKLRTLTKTCENVVVVGEKVADECEKKTDEIETDLNCNHEIQSDIIDSTIYEVDEMQIETEPLIQESSAEFVAIDEPLEEPLQHSHLSTQSEISLTQETVTEDNDSETICTNFNVPQPSDDTSSSSTTDVSNVEVESLQHSDGSHHETEHSPDTHQQPTNDVQSQASTTIATEFSDDSAQDTLSVSLTQEPTLSPSTTVDVVEIDAELQREKIEKIKLERRNQIRENYALKVKSGALRRSPSRIPIPNLRLPPVENSETSSERVETSSPVKMRIKKTPSPLASPQHRASLRNSEILERNNSPSPLDHRRSVQNFEGYVSPYRYQRTGSFKRPNPPPQASQVTPSELSTATSPKTQVVVTPLRTAINKRQRMVDIDQMTKIFEPK